LNGGVRPPLPPGPFLVVGLARSGVAVALALRARGLAVTGCDAGPVGEESAAALARAGVPVHDGVDGVALLDGVATLVKSPGVPQEAEVVRAARAGGVRVLGELEVGWRLVPNDVVAITGSNGKTTTTELVGAIHRAAGAPVAVAGNVGTALSSLAGALAPDAVVICECSSFQLEDAEAFAPDAAALINLAPDHLDRHGSFAAYRAAKLRIFAHQPPGAVAVVPRGLEVGGRAERVVFALPPPAAAAPEAGGRPERATFAPPPPATVALPRDPEAGVVAHAPPEASGPAEPSVAAPAGQHADVDARDGVLRWRGTPVMPVAEIRLRGAHNLENAMVATALALARGLDPAAVRTALRSFAGVEHRLEEVATRDGVLYVDDSKATNVASAVVGIRSFPGGVHAILGGRGKGEDYAPLAAAAAERCRAAYLIGEEAGALAAALAAAGVPAHDFRTLDRAVAAAGAAAAAGDVVLLSPACASYDQYRSFAERGRHFRALVEA
jgi:UDP-N-acetylmuramoylalanine--D-glutamate ligase